jgi:hypothetical protein
MPTHNSVPSVCTASMITGWGLQDLAHTDDKIKSRARLRTVTELISAGFKEDFALIFAITTEQQILTCASGEFLPKLGFQPSFTGEKQGSVQRHKETGQLTMWCTTPENYKTALTAYKKELEAHIEKIDPPKKPDPARQKFADIRLRALIDAGIVKKNAHADNSMKDILNVSEEKARTFIRLKFGVDLYAWSNRKKNWVNASYRDIKANQDAWKKQLV